MQSFSRQSLSRASRLRSRSRQRLRPSLRFTPYAWAKLLFLRDLGDTEVGGFGISAPDDLLLVMDFILVPQICSAVTVAFEDEAVADFFDQQIDLGRRPENCGRIWIHTHPGDSAQPSGVDEETFARVFGQCDWAVMAIVACGGQTSARLRFQAGPGGSLALPTDVDFQTSFAASDHEAWTEDYLTCVKAEREWRLSEEAFSQSLPSAVEEFSAQRAWQSPPRFAEFLPRPGPPFLPG